jgi:hypothetical protein
MTRFLFTFGIRNTSDSYVLVSVVRPLWREDGSVFCKCRWPLPAQSFSGPSPLGLELVLYCLRFETSLFVASYDSQGHSGGIRPRLPSYRLLLYRLSTDHTENTCHVSDCTHWSVTNTGHDTDHIEDTSSVVLYKHSTCTTAESTASLLLCDVTTYARLCSACVA